MCTAFMELTNSRLVYGRESYAAFVNTLKPILDSHQLESWKRLPSSSQLCVKPCNPGLPACVHSALHVLCFGDVKYDVTDLL